MYLYNSSEMCTMLHLLLINERGKRKRDVISAESTVFLRKLVGGRRDIFCPLLC